MAGQGVVLPPVGATAVVVAAIRAIETDRPDRLFADRLAASFVRAAGSGDPAQDRSETRERRASVTWVTIRTRFLDDVALESSAGGCRQVVILGAGLDARAFRLDWPANVRLFELDLPAVLEFKEQVVSAENWQPGCDRVTVPVDLSGDWGRPLVDAGFDAQAPVLWLAEGLLAYLSPQASDALVARAGRLSAPTSRMGLTLASAERLRAWREAHPDGSTGKDDYVALWRSVAPDKAVEWLASHGWKARVFDVAERSAAYGRPLEEHARPATGARLVDATRAA
jgi:methyltransferase (TIGR00027 family)